jgi:hypothetical protein
VGYSGSAHDEDPAVGERQWGGEWGSDGHKRHKGAQEVKGTSG